LFFKQYYLGSLAHASYLVADEGSGVAVVIDPQRDIQQYVEEADRRSLRIAHVFLTHFHADFVAGHLELRDRCGAEIHLGARASAEYPFTPMADGSELRIGDVLIQVAETPGHSPESISIVVYDLTAEERAPFAVLTGDTLFIGDVGRPDLRAALGWAADDLAALLYDSVHEKLMRLPDETLVYPAHGAGSLCGKHLSSATVSTIGVQRAENYALQPMSRDQFVKLVVADQPDAPAYFTFDAVLNTHERPTLEQALERELQPLTIDQLLSIVREGAQLLDCRHSTDFEDGHLTASIGIGLEGSFETWCGTLLDPERPIALIADPGREGEAVTRLGRIGFDCVAGYLAGGIGSLDGAAPDLLVATERITTTVLAQRLEQPDAPELIDVRTAAEYAEGRIDGAINLPLATLSTSIGTLDRSRPIVVYCESGYRSAIAASLLRRDGISGVSNLVGGLAAWADADQPADGRAPRSTTS
jgi:hydroxyacylglutathione hydrolase